MHASLSPAIQIKHALRTKDSLETCIQDTRAGISTNQQSISIQEKRSRDEVSKYPCNNRLT